MGTEEEPAVGVEMPIASPAPAKPAEEAVVASEKTPKPVKEKVELSEAEIAAKQAALLQNALAEWERCTGKAAAHMTCRLELKTATNVCVSINLKPSPEALHELGKSFKSTTAEIRGVKAFCHEVDAHVSASGEPASKRPRGRPPKNQNKDQDATPGAKKRGRPSKSATTTPSADEPKKKRGRPPKEAGNKTPGQTPTQATPKAEQPTPVAAPALTTTQVAASPNMAAAGGGPVVASFNITETPSKLPSAIEALLSPDES